MRVDNINRLDGIMCAVIRSQRCNVAEAIIEYMEGMLFHSPPEPFILAGTLVKELPFRKSDIYLALGQLMGVRIGEYREGKKKYYYILDMVIAHRDYLKRRA